MNPWNERFQGDEYVFGTDPNVFIADMHKKWKPWATHWLSQREKDGMRCSWPGRHERYRMGLHGISLNKANRLAEASGCADSHGACGSPRCAVEAGPMG